MSYEPRMERDYQGGHGGAYDGGFGRGRGRSMFLLMNRFTRAVKRPALHQAMAFSDSSPSESMADYFRSGPVTDYGSSMVQWMRHRQPRYKGGARVELERPSVSYIIDVCSKIQISSRISATSAKSACIQLIWWCRCFHQQLNWIGLQTLYLQSIYIRR